MGTQVAEGGLPLRYDGNGGIAVATEPKETRTFDGVTYVMERGIVTDYPYDALNRLILLRHYNDNGAHVWEDQVDSLLSEFAYTVRAAGKRTV